MASGNASVRAAAAETCVHAIFSEPTLAAVAKGLTDPAAEVRRAAIRALSVNANWRSATAQKALVELATQPGKAVESMDRVGAVDGIVQAVRLQVKGVRQDPELFRALVTLLDDKDEELRVMAANTLAPIRDREFRGDLGRPERKTPEGGWAQWLDGVSAKAAGYLKDYEVCGWGKANAGSAPLPGNRGTQEPVDVFCQGGAALLGYNLGTGQPVRKEPRAAFQYTLRAAEQGYVPAEAAVAMMYANGKGVEQSFAEAAKWWVKAAESGHVLAASHASMVYRGGGGVKPDQALSAKWAKFAEEHTPAFE